MTGYDFDKTIYDGNSFIDFYLFCLKRHKWIVLFLTVQLIFGVITLSFSRKRSKRIFCMFLMLISDIEHETELFWDESIHKIRAWYYDNRERDDIIVSASPEFFLKPICERLEIRQLIGTKMNADNGKIYGKNIYGRHKVEAYRTRYGGQRLNAFYTDSRSDFCMREVSDVIYRVKGNKISKLPDEVCK